MSRNRLAEVVIGSPVPCLPRVRRPPESPDFSLLRVRDESTTERVGVEYDDSGLVKTLKDDTVWFKDTLYGCD